jgi:hypothetical protein
MQYLSEDSIPLPLREARQALEDQIKDADAMARAGAMVHPRRDPEETTSSAKRCGSRFVSPSR